MITAPLHPPGSDDARREGCTCPVIDNARGKGAGVDDDGHPLFWYSDECPYHSPREVGR